MASGGVHLVTKPVTPWEWPNGVLLLFPDLNPVLNLHIKSDFSLVSTMDSKFQGTIKGAPLCMQMRNLLCQGFSFLPSAFYHIAISNSTICRASLSESSSSLPGMSPLRRPPLRRPPPPPPPPRRPLKRPPPPSEAVSVSELGIDSTDFFFLKLDGSIEVHIPAGISRPHLPPLCGRLIDRWPLMIGIYSNLEYLTFSGCKCNNICAKVSSLRSS